MVTQSQATVNEIKVGKVESVTDLLKGKPFHPEMTRVKDEEYLSTPIRIYDANVYDEWDGKFGKSSFVYFTFKAENADDTLGELKLARCGGVALPGKFRRLKKMGRLPSRDGLRACIMMRISEATSFPYADFI